ncbi:MAG: diguanylate cyclase [Gammaproteobacteria bacterium]|nr:MAG: diguanylate cyclase [Gammaproteobacteria bacterium]
MFRQLLRFGIRQKVVLILLATLVVGLTASTWLALRSQASDILQETDRRGQEISHFVARTLAFSVIAYDYHTVELLLKDLAAHDDVVYAKVVSPRGNTMGEFGAGNTGRAGVTTFRKDIRLNDETVGQLYLGLSTDRITAAIERQKQESILRQLLVIFSVLAVELVALSYIIIRPLNLMSRAMHEPAADGVAPNLPVTTQDEFGEIATQFNTLHARLNEAHEKLRSRVEHADQALARAYEQLAAQANELKRKNVDLELLSITDPLTGLYNKRYFEKLMESEIERCVHQNQICSIVLVDLDHFKKLNGQYGHKVGDSVLREIARLLALRTRKTDVLCRFGGDEFFLLCRQATMANAMNVADQLHEAITRDPLLVDGQAIPASLSIGIASIPSPHAIRTAGEFFECADAALRRSKQVGRNTVVHYSRMPPENESTPR